MERSTTIAIAVVIIVIVIVAGLYVAWPYLVPKPTLRVGYTGSAWPGHAPMWVGIQKGWFEEAGLDVEYINMPVSTDRLKVVASGAADICSTGEQAAWSALAAGMDFWLVGWHTFHDLEAIVVSEEIQTFDDLRGKTIAGPHGTDAHLLMYIAAEMNGLTIFEDFEYLNMGADAAYVAFKAGEVDGIAEWEPWVTKPLEEVPGAHVLFWDKDTWFYEDYGMWGINVFAVSKRFAEDYPDLLKEWMRVLQKSVDFVEENPTEAAEVGAQFCEDYLAIVVDEEYLKWQLETGLDWVFAKTELEAKLDDAIEVSEWVVNEYMIPNDYITVAPDIAAHYTTEFAP